MTRENNNIAKNLLQIKAIKLSPQNPFTWASGLKSPIYCDNRITLSYPEIRDNIKHGFIEIVHELMEVNHISAVATAGIAHGAILADALDLPFSYVRSSAKKHGRQNRIEGFIEPGSNVLLIEDLISTGKSSIEAVEVLRAEGHNILAVASIFTYDLMSSKHNFMNAKCISKSITSYSELLDEAVKMGYVGADEEELLKQWNADPEEWSEIYEKNKYGSIQ